jgi:hypothetical protein
MFLDPQLNVLNQSPLNPLFPGKKKKKNQKQTHNTHAEAARSFFSFKINSVGLPVCLLPGSNLCI